MHERALSVLACRYADSVVLDCPRLPTGAFVQQHGIHLIATPSQEFGRQLEKPLWDMVEYIPDHLAKISSQSIIARILEDYELYDGCTLTLDIWHEIDAKKKRPR
ncbi:hypothetical protein HDU91_003999 [Kappamyces sp. JEL0680]|nr:hypothetical protein HDU91_003999 [Kappamyces sp. JEL0680]